MPYLCLESSFLVTPTPQIVTVTPDYSINNQAVTVTITGKKFTKSSSVKLVKPGETEIIASQVNVISKTKIECKFELKDQPGGKWDVVVANQDKITSKLKTATLAGGFRIEYPAPRITAVEPGSGLIDQKVALTLSGSGFRNGATINLSNKQVDIGTTKINLISTSKISCEVNLAGVTPGAYDLKIINDDNKSAILNQGFVAIAPQKPVVIPIPVPKVIKPEITAINPNKGFNNGMVLCNITGKNFHSGATVKLIGPGPIEVPGLNLKVESAEKITCFFDINQKPIGEYDLEVSNPDGQKDLLVKGFTTERFVPSAVEINNSLKPIFFDFDKSLLKTDQTAALENDLKILLANPSLYILLGGHTDERGSQEYNLDLSARRSQAVKAYLVAKGVDPARINIYSYGKSSPLKTGHDESAWLFNRRVEIIVGETPPTKEQGLTKPNNP